MKTEKKKTDDIIQAEDLLIAKYLSNEFILENIIPSEKNLPPFQEFQSQPRKFKDKTFYSNETVKWIINTLKQFFKNTSFKIVPHPFLKSPSNIWTIHGFIYHKFRPFFKAYGRGLTIEDAMASFYGELAERIQVGFFFSRNPYKSQILPYFKFNVSDEDKKLNKEFINLLKNNSYSFVYKFLLSEIESSYYNPYRDITSNRTVWIMNKINKFTTGCASGNSYEQAFVNAFNEIVERYSSFSILKKKKNLPTIPEKRLSPHIRHLIKRFKQNNIQIIVKDASLDLNIPSVAILFIIKNKKLIEKKNFNRKLVTFGAASSLDVAIERCITEAEQDINSLRLRAFYNSLYGKSIVNLYETFPQLERFLPIRDYFVESFAQNNYFPPQYLEFLKEDYGTIEFEEYNKDDLLDEVNYILDFLNKRGYHIYLKDCSFFSTPTVRLFIPEMNIGFGKLIIYSNNEIEIFKQKLLAKEDLNKEDLNVLDTAEFILLLSHLKYLNNFFQIDTITLEQYSVWKFFGLLALAFNLKEIANKYFQQISYKTSNQKNKTEILTELAQILPNCQKSCYSCRFKRECKFPVLEPLESRVVEAFPRYLRGIEGKQFLL